MLKSAVCKIFNFLETNDFDYSFSRDEINDKIFYDLCVPRYYDIDVIIRDNFVDLCQTLLNTDVEGYERKGVYWTTINDTKTINGKEHECKLDIRLVFDMYDNPQWR